MLKGVIFDVDGTLVDSVSQHAHAWQDAFRAYGIETVFDDVHRQIGKGSDQLLPVFLSPEQIDQFGKELSEKRTAIFRENYLPSIKGFPKVRELFDRIQRDRLQIALGSSAKGEELEHYKKLAGIGDLQLVATTADDVERSKPHPDIFASALEKLGLAATEAIAVGDTPHDAEAATRAGMPTIGLLSGGWRILDLLDAGCVAVYDDPAMLLADYNTSPLARLSHSAD